MAVDLDGQAKDTSSEGRWQFQIFVDFLKGLENNFFTWAFHI